jgi:enoyl-[acyl-carrier protein] reductase/trans-2-enoyl-CoA reductase (NAD+)
MSQEVIRMKSRGFICVNAHPEGCRRNVERQARAITKSVPRLDVARNVLVIGSSTGYGLASRISAAWGSGASTCGVFFERPPERGRTATAGYYNTAAFHEFAHHDGLRAFSLNADAFADATKRETADLLRREMAPVDLVIYSLASPKRTHPRTGEVFNSVLKPIGREYSSRTIDLDSQCVTGVTIPPATEKEIEDTIAVMGGEDWRMWIEALLDQDLLARGARTLAYSYIGPQLTWPIYRDGTIGLAKKHLDSTAASLDHLLLQRLGGHAWIAVNKAIVTQASAAIPVVPLYMGILRKVMQGKNLEEGAIEQMRRLFTDFLAASPESKLDDSRRLRLDDREMRPDVQEAVSAVWPLVTTENLAQFTDFAGFQRDFRNLFGFEVDGVDYAQPVEIEFGWSRPA